MASAWQSHCVMPTELEAAYQQMAADEDREALAFEWAEATIGDGAGQTR